MPAKKDNEESTRLDLWLWAVRFYKSRALAAEACRKGWVTVGGQRVKPGRAIRVGEELAIRHQNLEKTVVVRGLLKRRVGAKVVDQHCEDRTPPEVYARAEEQRKLNASADLVRDRGAGRPTKRERREMEEVILEAEQRETVYRQWDKLFKKNGKNSK